MVSAESSKHKCPMEERDRFARLYDVIVDIYRSYTANFVWTVGLLSLANGWFLSTSSGRDFIRASVPAYLGTILVVSTIGLIHTAGSWMYYRRSQERIAQLMREYTDLHPLPFRDYQITTSIFVVNLLASWMLIVGLIIFVVAAHTSLP